jgi:asparagine synthase (glutamine-hydrolysing)
MCGLAGYLDSAGSIDTQDGIVLLGRMASALAHRGPDDAGGWIEGSVALGHRRLAILDLSSAGHQPMHSADGRYVLVFNGEIYNHLDLRIQLGNAGAAPAWRGYSDTETMLAVISAWGIENALRRFVGMFAFALWDRKEFRLILARDRIGEKPLYYGWQGKAFLFGSELKALAAHPAWSPEVAREALTLFMRYGYVPEPWSIYRGVRKLPPGCWLELRPKETAGLVPEPRFYWSAQSTVKEGSMSGITESAVALSELEQRLGRAISRQCIADVPLGAFLSGGVDSSTVVALMQAQSSRPVRTFTIGFHETEYNEAEHAKAVARHLGTDHTELYVTAEEAQAVVPHLPELYDEPFADPSQIPTHLVALIARQQVTVALSGDGGDELFGGYDRYVLGRKIWRRIGPLPVRLRRAIGRIVASVSPQRWDSLLNTMGLLLPHRIGVNQSGDRLHKLATILDAESSDALYRHLLSQLHEPAALVIGGSEPTTWADEQLGELKGSDFTERMMFHDLVGYLPGDILTKVDRAAMGVSLETRIPLLDHEVVEFAWRVPQSMKFCNGQRKWLLRQLLYKYVPRELIERPKQGFGIPLDRWLRGPLRDWAEFLLDADRLGGYLNPAPVRKRWEEHLSGRRNWHYSLWSVLMFQAWLDRTTHCKHQTDDPQFLVRLGEAMHARHPVTS